MQGGDEVRVARVSARCRREASGAGRWDPRESVKTVTHEARDSRSGGGRRGGGESVRAVSGRGNEERRCRERSGESAM